MPIPFDTRKKPQDVKVHVTSGGGIDIVWSDGHRSHFDFAYLRENCPCATCNDERSKKASFAESAGAAPSSLPGSLPMFKPKPRARSAQAVGNYAIRVEFSDGHSTGIYSYDYLRTMCPCDACARDFRSA
jgi:DUF971 family protein